MSVDNTDDELVITRSPTNNSKSSSQPATVNSSSSDFTPRTASTSALYHSASLPSALTPFS